MESKTNKGRKINRRMMQIRKENLELKGQMKRKKQIKRVTLKGRKKQGQQGQKRKLEKIEK